MPSIEMVRINGLVQDCSTFIVNTLEILQSCSKPSILCAHNMWSRDIKTELPPLSYKPSSTLTHWGRVTHIWVRKQTIIGSDKGLSPGRRQAIIWTNAGMLLIQTLITNFNEILR